MLSVEGGGGGGGGGGGEGGEGGGGGGDAVLADQLQAVQKELAVSCQDVVCARQERDALRQQLDPLRDKLNVAEVGRVTCALQTGLLTCFVWFAYPSFIESNSIMKVMVLCVCMYMNRFVWTRRGRRG